MQSIVKCIETKTYIKLEREREKGSKQFTREYLKYYDTEKYEEQKRKDRGRKRLEEESNEKEAAAVASMDQNQESTSTPSSAFKYKHLALCGTLHEKYESFH